MSNIEKVKERWMDHADRYAAVTQWQLGGKGRGRKDVQHDHGCQSCYATVCIWSSAFGSCGVWILPSLTLPCIAAAITVL